MRQLYKYLSKVNIGFFLILTSAILWGIAGLYVRGLAHYVHNNMLIVFLRAFFTVLFLAAIILFRDRSLFRIRLKDVWLFLCNAIFSIVMFNFCYYQTMKLSSLSVAAVLLYTAPFFVMFISVPLFKEKLTLQKVGACLIAFIGCALVSGLTPSGLNITSRCLAYGLLTGFGYALYTVFGGLLLRRGYATLTITFYTFTFATLATLPFLVKEMTVFFASPTLVVPLRALSIAVAMALFNTVLPYLFYTTGLKTVAPDRAPIIATVEPVVATLTGMIYHEYPDWLGWLGMVLVVSAIVILNMKLEKKHDSQSIRKTESDA